jgi:hypothetical protein
MTPLPVKPSRSRWPLVLGAVLVLVLAGGGFATWKLVLAKSDDRLSAAAGEPPVAVENEPEQVVTKETPPQPATKPAGQTTGTLDIEVTGAKDSVIYVDGEEWGRGASIKVPLSAGTHEIKVKPPGRSPIVQTTTIEAGQDNRMTIVVPKEKTVVIRRGGGTKTQPKDTPPPPPSDDALLAPKKKKK